MKSGRGRALVWVLVLAVLVVPWLLLTEAGDWPKLVAKAEARGRVPSVEAEGWGWFWWASWLNWGGLCVLLATVPWWTKANSLVPVQVQRKTTWTWRSVTLVVLILTGALVLRLPQMTDSFYNDEAHNYARLISGTWQKGKEGDEVLFRATRWGETFWRNSGGNNAQPFSVVARLCLEAVKGLGWVREGEVCEWAVTLPSLLAGMVTMGLLSGLVWRRFGAVAGLTVLFVLAIHPWHVRHSTIARGHMLMLLGMSLMLWCLAGALREGRWRQWLGYGFGLFLCATSFIGSVYFLAVFNVGLLGMQAWRWKRGDGGSDLVWRPIMVGLLAAMAGVQLMLPILPELVEILRNNPAFRGVMGWRWWQDAAGFMFCGTRWLDHAPSNPVNQALERWLTEPLWWPSLLLWLGLLMMGTWRLVWLGGLWRLLSLGTLLGVLAAWGLATLQGNYLNLWYLFFTVPYIAIALGLGAVWLRERRSVTVVVAVLAVALLPQMRVSWRFRELPKQHERAPVEVARGARYPAYLKLASGQEPLTAAFWSNANLYDPQMKVLRSVEELDALVQQARAEKRPLFVAFSHRQNALQTIGDGVRRLEESGDFALAGLYYGQEEDQFTVHVYQLQ